MKFNITIVLLLSSIISYSQCNDFEFCDTISMANKLICIKSENEPSTIVNLDSLNLTLTDSLEFKIDLNQYGNCTYAEIISENLEGVKIKEVLKEVYGLRFKRSNQSNQITCKRLKFKAINSH